MTEAHDRLMVSRDGQLVTPNQRVSDVWYAKYLGKHFLLDPTKKDRTLVRCWPSEAWAVPMRSGPTVPVPPGWGGGRTRNGSRIVDGRSQCILESPRS